MIRHATTTAICNLSSRKQSKLLQVQTKIDTKEKLCFWKQGCCLQSRNSESLGFILGWLKTVLNTSLQSKGLTEFLEMHKTSGNLSWHYHLLFQVLLYISSNGKATSALSKQYIYSILTNIQAFPRTEELC